MNKLYIWERVEECSTNYHSEGGVIAVGSSEEDARQKANAYITEGRPPDYPIKGIRKEEKADHIVLLIENVDFEVLIFPDAGCC